MPSLAPSLEVEEDRLAGALEDDVEAIHGASSVARYAAGKQCLATRGGNQRQHRVGVVGRVVREVEPGGKRVEQAAREDHDRDMRRLHTTGLIGGIGVEG